MIGIGRLQAVGLPDRDDEREEQPDQRPEFIWKVDGNGLQPGLTSRLYLTS